MRRARTGGPTHRLAAPSTEPSAEPQELEVSPLTRIHRSRLAFAMAVTLAAVPVLVVDNMSATAETNETRVEVAAPATERQAESSTTGVTVPPTATAAAPTTSTVAATSSTEAPTTTDAVVVQALRAPAPTVPPTTAAPPPATTTTTSTTTAAPASYGDPSDPATWERLAGCESGGNWTLNSGNGYYGGLQFSLATWRDVGGTGYPHLASKAEQIKRGELLQARYGWGQWPYCANLLGYV